MQIREHGFNTGLRDRLQNRFTAQPFVRGTHDLRQPFFAHVPYQHAREIHEALDACAAVQWNAVLAPADERGAANPKEIGEILVGDSEGTPHEGEIE